MSTPSRPLSELTQVTDIRDDDFLTLLRTSEPLPEDQNVIMAGRRAKEILGTGGGGTPAPSLPLYGGPGTHTDGPMHQQAATVLANRGPNASPAAAAHLVRYLRNTDRPSGDTTSPTLDTLLLSNVVGLKHEVVVIDPKAGQPERVRVLYASGGFDCWRDGDNNERSAGEFIDVASPRAQAQPYAYYGPAYGFVTTDIVRAVPTDAPGAEVFFSPASSGVRPAPTLAAGDANWVRVAPPVVGPGIPLSGTAPGHPVSDTVFFKQGKGVSFIGDGGQTFDLYGDDILYLTRTPPGGSPQELAEFTQSALILPEDGELTLRTSGGGSAALSASPGGGLLVSGDIELTDPTTGIVMSVGGTRVRAQIGGTPGARTWTFTDL